MYSPLVSIVINNYNYAQFLGESISSALKQTYDNIEVIVVDDGSTDNSRSLLEGFGDRIRTILKPNGGQASAFNVGITEAQGEFILMLDADDRLLPMAVRECIDEFPDGYSRVYYRLRTIDTMGDTLSETGDPGHFKAFNGDVFEAARNGDRPFLSIPTTGNFFAADKLKSVLPIPEIEYRICADSFILTWTGLRGSVKSIDRVLGEYRIHGKNSFAFASFEFFDSWRLKVQIENYYRTDALMKRACRVAGYELEPRLEETSSHMVQCLCIGYRLRIESREISRWNVHSLSGLVLRFLRSGDLRVYKRVILGTYLLLVLYLPEVPAKYLIKWSDRIRRQKALHRLSRSHIASTSVKA
jgi:glycosyltransferase involved in cell wall biosynthesis